jgi:hypothetical protein
MSDPTTEPTPNAPASTGGTVLSQAASSAPAPSSQPQLPEWLGGSVPDDLKSELPTLSRFKTPADLAKSYVHLNKKRNESLAVPAEDAKPEDWDAFYAKLGRPESPDKYELKLPEGAPMNEEMLKGFKELAHKSGILPKQAQAALEWYQGVNKQAVEAYEAKSKEAVNALLQEWGDKKDEKLARIGQAMAELVDPKDREALEKSAWGNYPPLLRLLDKAADLLKEAPVRGENTNRFDGDTKAVQKRIAEIQANPAFLNRSHPEREVLMSEWRELHEKLYGTDNAFASA